MNDDKKKIDELLNKWFELKSTIKSLENKMDEYKNVASQLMFDNDTNKLENGVYRLEQKEMTRTSIALSELPSEIRNQYSKLHTYKSFYISEINKIRRSRSPNKEKKLLKSPIKVNRLLKEKK